MNYRLRSLAGLCALLASMSGQAADGKAVYEKGGENPAALACVTCHGADGMGMPAAGFPRVAGLSAGYIEHQLKSFADGSRGQPVMEPIAQALSADEMKAVAEYMQTMPAPEYKKVNRSELVTDEGSKLALRGDWSRNIPECVACHGPGGIGVGTAFPPLAGQSAAYISGQLNAWRQGTRKNDPADLMGHIARSLTDEEVKAVSDYFANLNQ